MVARPCPKMAVQGWLDGHQEAKDCLSTEYLRRPAQLRTDVALPDLPASHRLGWHEDQLLPPLLCAVSGGLKCGYRGEGYLCQRDHVRVKSSRNTYPLPLS